MKITDNRKKNLTYFKRLMVGTVFVFENKAYIRIPEVENNSTIYNTVNLSVGRLDYFADSCNVELINSELILKD